MSETKLPIQIPINFQPEPIPVDDILKKRVYAFFLDMVFISLINRAIIYTYLNFIDYYLPHINPEIKNAVLGNFTKIQFPIYTISFLAYFVVSYYISNGKTPAKVIFGLKVHGKDLLNDNVTLKEASLRASCYYLGTVFGFVMLVIPLFRKNQKGIPDIISNTDVYTELQLKLKKDNFTKQYAQKEEASESKGPSTQLDLFAS